MPRRPRYRGKNRPPSPSILMIFRLEIRRPGQKGSFLINSLISLSSKIRMRFEATIMVHHSTSIPQHFRGPKPLYIRLYKNI